MIPNHMIHFDKKKQKIFQVPETTSMNNRVERSSVL